ncbi:white collar 2 type of transcription factor [Pisolithus croceorrhizus]|nr:white collar 2 type of transcription factor [Pisolithus croceorrhizus]
MSAQSLPTGSAQRHSQARPSSSSNASQIPSTFEFTKRKRWADLLINELSDAIIFVLSGDAKVWFCGRAIIELLGWRDTELIDRNFLEFVNAEDQQAFHVAFQDSLHTRKEMNSYVRLQCKNGFAMQHYPQSQVLFELKGYPLYLENETSPRCFLAVAKPYPSRNVAMLNTFLELKIENERLQRRLAELRVRTCSPTIPTAESSTSTSNGYTSHGLPTAGGSAAGVSRSYPQVAQATHYQSSRQPWDDFAQQANQIRATGYDPHSAHLVRGQHSSSGTQPVEDACDDTSRRKKMRKSHGAEQHVCVTCGRTDSPEWRKGPQGPKTLCNACGLRWAKEVRNKGEENSCAVGTSGGVV